MKKVYILLADGFEEIEALTPWDLLKRAGADVKLVSVLGKDHAEGSHKLIVKTDTVIDDINDIPDMVILPGGMPGTKNLASSDKVKKLVLSANEQNKYISAICAAPSVLGGYGILNGKKAISFPGFEDQLTGAKISKCKVVLDGNIITAKGMGVSLEFGLKIIEVLFGKAKSDELRSSVQA